MRPPARTRAAIRSRSDRRYGEALAAEVVPLDRAPHTRATFEAERTSPDKFRQRRAQLMLEAYDEAAPVRQTPYPVQAVRLGADLTLVALGGEVVVDYVLRAKRQLAGENLIVAGYCHDVMGHIPSRRVLGEGGYEAVDSNIYYGQPGPLAETVEEAVFAAIHRVAAAVGISGGRPSGASRASATSRAAR